MFIEKSKQALKKTDAHTGERDYLHVKKDDTGFDIKVPNGKTKLKLTKGFGKSGEVSQEFDVVGSGNAIGVEGMNKIVVGNAFADDYCEAYSGYLTYDDGAECAPIFSGYMNGKKVYDTKCYEVFFNYAENDTQMRWVTNDVVHAERFYKEVEHPFRNESAYASVANTLPLENLSVRCFRIYTTEALLAFQTFFETPRFMEELNESDNIFFKDGLDVCIGRNESSFLYKDWGTYFEEEPTAKKYENAFFINQNLNVDGYGSYSLFLYYCTDSVAENGIALGGYIPAFHKISINFATDELLQRNLKYLVNNFAINIITNESAFFYPKAFAYFPHVIVRLYFDMGGIILFDGREYYFIKQPSNATESEIFEVNKISIDSFDYRIGSIRVPIPASIEWGARESATSLCLGKVAKCLLGLVKNKSSEHIIWCQRYTLEFDAYSNIVKREHFKFLRQLVSIWGILDIYHSPTPETDPVVSASGEFCLDYTDVSLLSFFKRLGYPLKFFKHKDGGGGNKGLMYMDNKVMFLRCPISESAPPSSYWGNQIKNTMTRIVFENWLLSPDYEMVDSQYYMQLNSFSPSTVHTFSIENYEYIVKNFNTPARVSWGKFIATLEGKKLTVKSDEQYASAFLEYLVVKIGASNLIVDSDYCSENILASESILYGDNNKGLGVKIKTLTMLKKNGVNFSFANNHVHYLYFGETVSSKKSNPVLNLVSEPLSLITGMDKGFHWWLKWEDELGLSVLNYSGDGEPIPSIVKKYLQEVCIVKATQIISELKEQFVVYNERGTSSFTLTDGQIKFLMEQAISNFFMTGVMEVSFDAVYYFVYLEKTDSGYESRNGSGSVSIHVKTGMRMSYEVYPSGIDATVTGSASNSPQAGEPEEQQHERVAITVTDSGKTRTIGYTSPIAIESISVEGQRIDVVNQKLKDGTLRKFSVGSSTVTWGENMITIYNFSTVTSLKIGDASFVF